MMRHFYDIRRGAALGFASGKHKWGKREMLFHCRCLCCPQFEFYCATFVIGNKRVRVCSHCEQFIRNTSYIIRSHTALVCAITTTNTDADYYLRRMFARVIMKNNQIV